MKFFASQAAKLSFAASLICAAQCAPIDGMANIQGDGFTDNRQAPSFSSNASTSYGNSEYSWSGGNFLSADYYNNRAALTPYVAFTTPSFPKNNIMLDSASNHRPESFGTLQIQASSELQEDYSLDQNFSRPVIATSQVLQSSDEKSLVSNSPVTPPVVQLHNMPGLADVLPLRMYQESNIQSTADWQQIPQKLLTLNFTTDTAYSDCYARSLVLVNGQFPGPPINVKEGEVFSLLIVNSLAATSLTIHLHGIYQLGTPYYDGTAGVSQISIPPGGITTYTYRVVAQSGTFWYHAHNDMLAHLIYGPLIVESAKRNDKEIFQYDEDRVLVLGDYWRDKAASAMVAGLNNKTFQFVGDPDSLLTNGRTVGDISHYNQTHMQTDKLNNTCRFSTILVEPNKTYRLRIIAASSLSYLRFAIDAHTMTLIEADGTIVEPREVNALEINSGQRYSVLIRTNRPVSMYWMYMEAAWRPKTPHNGFSVLRYEGYNDPDLQNRYRYPKILKLPAEVSGGSIRQILKEDSRFTELAMPSKFTHFLKLDAKQLRSSGGYLRWYLNDVSLRLMQAPTLFDMYRKTTSNRPVNSRPVQIPLNSVLDLVVQNHVTTAGVCEQHALHLHGHSFWDIDSGPGLYVQGKTEVDQSRPLLRDVTTMYGYNYTYWIAEQLNTTFAPQTPCGWKYIRILFNNPGSWLFHCHASSHLSMGFGMVFNVGQASDLPKVPSNFPWLIPGLYNSQSNDSINGFVES